MVILSSLLTASLDNETGQSFRWKVHAPRGELEGQGEYFRIQDVWFIWRVLSETSVDCCLDDDAT
jgi:hypothetical protein